MALITFPKKCSIFPHFLPSPDSPLPLFLKVINLPPVKEETFVLAMITSKNAINTYRQNSLDIIFFIIAVQRRHAEPGIDINETFDRLKIGLNTLQFLCDSTRLTSSDTQFSPKRKHTKIYFSQEIEIESSLMRTLRSENGGKEIDA